MEENEYLKNYLQKIKTVRKQWPKAEENYNNKWAEGYDENAIS